MQPNEKYVKPNLFIVGAPKCGTTALSEYLRTHPDVFVLKQKETHYFCFDFDRRYPRPTSMQAYLNLFRKARGKKIIVDASPWYLYSENAIAEAYRFNPEAKFIAMVRNPYDMVPSLHRQLVNSFDEDATDLLSAWLLQEKRRSGENIPANCREPRNLQYREACKLGHQIESFFKMVPPCQRMVIVFDDFKFDTLSVYQNVLSFINVKDDGKTDFPIVNQAYQWRFKKFSNFAITPPKLIDSIGKSALNLLGIERIGLFRILYHINNKYNRKRLIRKNDPNERISFFRDAFDADIKHLSTLLQRDLSDWYRNESKSYPKGNE